MATTIKKVTLKSLGKNRDIDPMKGTVVNPFTQEEYNRRMAWRLCRGHGLCRSADDGWHERRKW